MQRKFAGCVVAVAVRRRRAGAGVGARPVPAPPPDPGFTYIFDGTATVDASFDKWRFAAGTAQPSQPGAEAATGRRR